MKLLVNGACGRMGRALLAMIDQGIQGAELAGAVDAYGSGDGILQSSTTSPAKPTASLTFPTTPPPRSCAITSKDEDARRHRHHRPDGGGAGK